MYFVCVSFIVLPLVTFNFVYITVSTYTLHVSVALLFTTKVLRTASLMQLQIGIHKNVNVQRNNQACFSGVSETILSMELTNLLVCDKGQGMNLVPRELRLFG